MVQIRRTTYQALCMYAQNIALVRAAHKDVWSLDPWFAYGVIELAAADLMDRSENCAEDADRLVALAGALLEGCPKDRRGAVAVQLMDFLKSAMNDNDWQIHPEGQVLGTSALEVRYGAVLERVLALPAFSRVSQRQWSDHLRATMLFNTGPSGRLVYASPYFSMPLDLGEYREFRPRIMVRFRRIAWALGRMVLLHKRLKQERLERMTDV
jgi:hypothetical protein